MASQALRPARAILIAAALLGVLAVSAMPTRAVPTAHAHESGAAAVRPIDDFVSRQGTFCIDINFVGAGYEDQIVDANFVGNCAFGAPPLLFVPPVANFLGSSDPGQQRLASVDYAGLADHWAGGALGTSVAGRVVERPLADGRALVTVSLVTDNALTWVVDDPSGQGDFGGPLLFGERVLEVAIGAEPALGVSRLQVKFVNTAPGAPLPDLLQLFVFPEPGQEVLGLRVNSRAKGPLTELFGVPDGSPGINQVVQAGLLGNPQCGSPPSALADCFPVERIDLHPIGG